MFFYYFNILYRPIIGILEWPYIDKDGDYIYEVFKGTNMTINEIKDINRSLNIVDVINITGEIFKAEDYE